MTELQNIVNRNYRQCVILNGEIKICPHDRIDGKTCSSCKYPDIYMQAERIIYEEINLDKQKGL